MNQSQIKHIRERASKIKRERIAAVQEKYAGKSLSDAAKKRALRDGNFEVITKPSRLYYVGDVIRFEGEVPRDQKAIDREVGKIEADFIRLMDEVVLGGAEDALNALRAFEAA